jgi:hypothetical protein
MIMSFLEVPQIIFQKSPARMRNVHHTLMLMSFSRSLRAVSRTRRARALSLSAPYLDAYIFLDDFPEKMSSAHAQ